MRQNEFDIHKINGENMVKSFIYAHMGRYSSKHTIENNEKKQDNAETRLDTRLPKSHAGEQGPYLRAPDHLGRGGEVKEIKSLEKSRIT